MDDLIDIGANLTHGGFRKDLSEVLDRALQAGVRHFLVTGTDEEESTRACDLAATNPDFMHATAGFHPHRAATFSADSESVLRDLASRHPVVAIGETGLDFHRNQSPPDVQQRVFERHLELAAELGMPVFLHQRDAEERFLEILREWRPHLVGAVAHCFTGGPDMVRACLDLDLHFGITGWICDARRGGAVQEAVRHIPRERLMVETDCPYLLPRDVDPVAYGLPVKNRRNEPCLLPHVVRATAQYAGMAPEELAESSTRVARSFFGLP